MKLNDVEKAAVRELSRNPAVTGLLNRIENEHGQVPKWRAGGSEDGKTNQWIYRSGFADGIEYVIKLLRYDNE